MSTGTIVTALAENWPATVPHLELSSVELMGELVRQIDAQRDEPGLRALEQQIIQVLIVRLPAGHPVREAIFSQRRFVTAREDWPAIADALRELIGSGAGTGAAERRLLAEPALDAQQVTAAGGNPDDDGLIRLPGPDGRIQLPAFQFGSDGRVLPVVAEINRILDATLDPWGVADWWLGRNAWLGAVPSQALGRVDDGLLMAAAHAEFIDG